MTYNRDPFARMDFVKEKVRTHGGTCSWCGQVKKDKKGEFLYKYGDFADGIRTKAYFDEKHLFCSVGCMRVYYS